MYILTSPFSKTFDTLGLIYFVPEFLETTIQEGIIVEVPMGKKIENALILQIVNNFEDFSKQNNLSFAEDKIKSIISVVDVNIVIDSKTIELICYIAEYYLTHIHHCANLFMTAGVRKKLAKRDEKFLAVLLGGEHKKCEFSKKLQFSVSQEIALEAIKENFCSDERRINLLYGITGSGKTHIYLELLQKELEKGKQSLLLIPEIILNNQIGEKIENFFGKDHVIIINSSVTETKKTKVWARVFSGEPLIIVGTRSALFLPYKQLELIIMDEEHDQSYISDKSPRYKTKEILEKMALLNKDLKILLGSGTPSVNSMYKAVRGEWNLVSLLEKYS